MTEQNIQVEFDHELISIDSLQPHPRNYRFHPEDQIDHLVESIKKNGFYRNVVCANDGTILAGHGVIIACRRLKIEKVPVIRLPIDPDSPQAMKLLIGDNEIEHLGEKDDRVLTEMLKEIKETDIDGLFGTGFDEKMLANLLFVTRPKSEIEDFDEAAEWVGLPEYEPKTEITRKISVSFKDEAAVQEFAEKLGYTNVTDKTRAIWYPYKESDDVKSIKFE